MKVVELENVTLTVPQVAEMAKGGTVIITRNGKPLVSVKDLSASDWERIALANDPQFQTLIEESRRSYREHGGVSLDALRRELVMPRKRTRRRDEPKRA